MCRVMTTKADASPTKEFFVHYLTRDISLHDCILDLLDHDRPWMMGVGLARAQESYLVVG